MGENSRSCYDKLPCNVRPFSGFENEIVILFLIPASVYNQILATSFRKIKLSTILKILLLHGYTENELNNNNLVSG